jgi:hypothetical protein
LHGSNLALRPSDRDVQTGGLPAVDTLDCFVGRKAFNRKDREERRKVREGTPGRLKPRSLWLVAGEFHGAAAVRIVGLPELIQSCRPQTQLRVTGG